MPNPPDISTNLGKLDRLIELLGGGATPPDPSEAGYSKITDGTNTATVVDLGGGKYGLVVDTELTIDGGTFNIDNMYIATDGSNDVQIKTNTDGQIEFAGSPNDIFIESTTDASSFSTEKAFSFTSDTVIISNDAANEIEFSWDGATVHGKLKATEVLKFVRKRKTSIYIRSASGTDVYRVWAY